MERSVSVKFMEQPLTEVVDYLRGQIKAVVLIDRRALDDVGIPQDTPITAKFSDMSLRSVLGYLLRPLDLTWDLRDGALLITTPEETEGRLHRVVYDVVDLVKTADPSTPEEYDYDSLISLITTTIAPQTWDAVGGPGAIEAFRGGVVVSQSTHVHNQLQEMLTSYREARQLAEKYAESPPPFPSVRFIPQDPVVSKIKRALGTSVTLDLLDSPLHDVAEFIAAQSSVNVIVDHRALDDIGIGADTPITFQAEGIQLRHALSHMLGDQELTWLVRDQALLITTPEVTECMLTTRAYPVADLLGRIVDIDMFGAPLRPASHNDLVEFITSTVAPSTWDEVGGPGSFGFCPHIDVLLISQDPHIHEEIADVLARVRRHLSETAETSPSQDSQRGTEKTTLVIYHVASAAASPQPAPSLKPTPAGVTGQFGGAVIPRAGGSGRPGGQMSASPAIIPEQELLALVTELIEPGSWKKRDDVYSRAVPGRLIIRHTGAVHRQIGRLLERLGVTCRPVPSSHHSGPVIHGGGWGMF